MEWHALDVSGVRQAFGWGRAILLQEVAALRALGFAAITLKAERVGCYAWAMAGFDADGPTLEALKQALREELFRRGFQRDAFDELLDVAEGPWDIAGFHPPGFRPVRPHHHQRRRGVQDRDMTLGKAALLFGPKWRGRLDLKDGSPSLARFRNYIGEE